MTNRTVTTTIDPDRCIGCGECVRVCPSDTLSMQNGKAAVTGDQSLNCGHCQAVCPTEAVWVESLQNRVLDFTTFPHENRWIPYGDYDLDHLVRLMRSRRSCRHFLEKPVGRDHIEDLIRIGITAPSGTNSQQWTFTVLPNRKDVSALGERIGDFFEKLNRTAEKAWLRRLLKWIGKPELDNYYRNHYQSVRDALKTYQEDGIDLLFHGAAAAIIAASNPNASCPAEDALLATQNILLAAHAMGLGTCLIGFAVSAMQKDRSIGAYVGIPREETVYSAIALGHPDEPYQRMTGRKPFTLRYFEA
ncbi:MAG: nitroreductase family protein [Thermodesulfobacteriota bacterium]